MSDDARNDLFGLALTAEAAIAAVVREGRLQLPEGLSHQDERDLNAAILGLQRVQCASRRRDP